MDEKFSVSLELALNKWKSQVAKVKNTMQGLGKLSKSRIAIDSTPLKEMTAQQELLKQKINDIKASLQMASEDSKLFSTRDVLEMNAELQKLEGQLKSTTKSSTAFKKVGDNISGTMQKGMQSAKRFTLSLFGIHSIYRMLSRASSAYLQQDQETTNKIQAAWIGLGSVFAPLLQMVADFAIRAVSYLNIFIKALTGVDFLGNAMAKSMGKANKSAKALSKTLAGIDEITNLDNNSGGIGTDDTGWINEFNNIKLNPELVKFFDNLGKTLAPLKDNLGEIALTLLGVFVGGKLAAILLGIGGIGAVAFGAGIIIAELAAAIWLVVYATEEMNKISKINEDVQEQQIDLSKKHVDIMKEKIKAGELSEEQAKNMNKTSLDTIDKLTKENTELSKQPTFWEKITGVSKERQKRMEANNILIADEIRLLQESNKQGLLDEEGKKRLVKLMETQITNLLKTNEGLDINSDKYKNNIKQVDTLKENLETLTGKDYKASFKLEADTSRAKSTLSSFFNGLGGTVLKLLGFPVDIVKTIAKLDTGTSYVPNNQLAMIHQGEAVIPKKFNSREYFGMGNDDTNKLLEQLINRVENIEINPYTTIKDVGTASVNYINNQNRVMGRGVI